MQNKRNLYVNIVVTSLFVVSLAIVPFTTSANSIKTHKTFSVSQKNNSTKTPIGRNISGSVTAISGTTITVQNKKNGLSYSIDASNAVFPNQYGETENLSSIQIGDIVIARGDVSGITNVTASTIVDSSFVARTVFTGKVTAMTGSTFTITNKKHITYSIDASSATFKKGSTSISVTDVSVGDTVVVLGTLNVGTNVTATSMKVIAVPIIKKK